MTIEEANCSEMQKLKQMLRAKMIHFECKDCTIEPYVMARVNFTYGGKNWSCIHGFGSFGGGSSIEKDSGLLELWDGEGNPIGFLTAEGVLKEIER